MNSGSSTEKKARPGSKGAQGRPDFSKLFSRVEDSRKGKSKVAILCPAGDPKLLEAFISMLEKQTLRGFDLFLIWQEGQAFYHNDRLSLINAEERFPLGIAGCFFAGQAFLFNEGYEVVMNADIHADPGSPSMMADLVEAARKTRKACLPVSASPLDSESAKTYNSNHCGTYPRAVFEKTGFQTPFLWKGAEDFDFFQRLKDDGMVVEMDGLRLLHPFVGYTVYHKMEKKQKFYPYVTGNAKALLLRSERHSLLLFRYIQWYLFYRFFAAVFDDRELERAIRLSARFRIASYPDSNPPFSISRVKEKAPYLRKGSVARFFSNFGALLSLLAKGEAEVYTDRITLQEGWRGRLFLNTFKAALLTPLFLMDALLALWGWPVQRRKIIYPAFLDSMEEAASIFAEYVEKKEL